MIDDSQESFQREWCVAVLQYMANAYATRSPHYKNFFAGKIETVERTYAWPAKGLRRKMMKVMFNDINESAIEELHNLPELNGFLLAKFGKSLTDITHNRDLIIKNIIRRKCIISREEFDFVQAFINEHLSDPSKKKKIEILDTILFSSKKEIDD